MKENQKFYERLDAIIETIKSGETDLTKFSDSFLKLLKSFFVHTHNFDVASMLKDEEKRRSDNNKEKVVAVFDSIFGSTSDLSKFDAGTLEEIKKIMGDLNAYSVVTSIDAELLRRQNK